LFDIDRLNWDDRLVSLFGIPRGALPEVGGSSGKFGVTAIGVGVPSGIPISGAAGDQQAALFGQACFAAGQAKNTYGTGAFVLMNAGEQRPVGDARLITTLGCGLGNTPGYVLEGAIFTAGAVIQWLRDGLGILNSAEESQYMAESVSDNAGVYFVPALAGIGAPYWDSEARGTIAGITRGVSRNHIVRAALESMCYRTRDVVDAMVQNSGVPVAELRVDGGASANDFVCQFQADMLGVNVIRPRDVETTARGAAYLAGLGCGFWSDVSQLDGALIVDRVFVPLMDDDRREQLYTGWKHVLMRALGA
jgi:glycerol kinase